MDVLSDLIDHLFRTQDKPDDVIVIATAAVAAAVVCVRAVWRRARHIITIAHEGGHALVALLTGRRLSGIRLHSDTSGLTFTRGSARGPSAVFTLLAGYLAPALIGLGSAALIAGGKVVLLLWLTIVLLLAMLIMIRNVYGFFAVIVVGGVVFLVSWYAPTDVQGLVAYVATWFLLFGSVRPVGELWRQRSRGGERNSDPDQLADITHVPAPVWLVLFGLVNVASLLYGVGLLLPDAWAWSVGS